MRWQDLFADLEGRLAAQQRQELYAQVADQARGERAEVQLADRLAASRGRDVVVTTAAGRVSGRLDDVGRDWMLLEETGRRTAVVPIAAITSVVGVSRHSDEDRGMGRRFGLGSALRAISRDRAPVAVHDHAGGLSTGTIDIVAADHLELAEHPADALRRGSAITGHRVIPFAALAVVRRA